ncbi:hypothetical protein PIB30_051472 [Stylosanthes scabra]|uniref:Uncharacterized protein n=1 Tax=Stylosanthes scabra TaxID=79078 RepID=A0ABU6VG11_9FABA|nr:hypothetical protein [Stylosanthes scabra]
MPCVPTPLDKVLWHLIPLGDVPNTLASITTLHKIVSILEESWPIKATLEYCGRCLFSTKVSTIVRTMTIPQNIMDFSFRDASSNQTIRASLEQEWIIPKKVLGIIKELLLLVGLKFSRNDSAS